MEAADDRRGQLPGRWAARLRRVQQDRHRKKPDHLQGQGDRRGRLAHLGRRGEDRDDRAHRSDGGRRPDFDLVAFQTYFSSLVGSDPKPTLIARAGPTRRWIMQKANICKLLHL